MCGRYTFAPDLSQIGELFPGFEVPEELAPRYNIAPTQKVPVIPRPCHLMMSGWTLAALLGGVTVICMCRQSWVPPLPRLGS